MPFLLFLLSTLPWHDGLPVNTRSFFSFPLFFCSGDWKTSVFDHSDLFDSQTLVFWKILFHIFTSLLEFLICLFTFFLVLSGHSFNLLSVFVIVSWFFAILSFPLCFACIEFISLDIPWLLIMCLIVWNFGICRNFQVSQVLQSGFAVRVCSHRRFSLFSLAAYSVGLASCIWMLLLWPCAFKFTEKGLSITSQEVWPCVSLDCSNRMGNMQNSVPGTPSCSILLPVYDTANSCTHLTNHSQICPTYCPSSSQVLDSVKAETSLSISLS